MNNQEISYSEFVLALSKVKKWGATKVADYVIRHGYDFQECLNFLDLELDFSEHVSFDINIPIARGELKNNAEKGFSFVCLFDNEFPKKLCEGKEPVIYLYYAGDISLLNKKCITIVGTRKPTEPFISNGSCVTSFFAKKGYVIVSGLALGCDSIAHRATLESGGKTIAILPSSLDNIVPAQNEELAQSIVENGGLLVSEYSVGSTMNKFNFPMRDRIQSLLSNVMIIIQSDDNGGTMIAAKKSLNEGKNVYALKGNNISSIENYISNENNELSQIEQYI